MQSPTPADKLAFFERLEALNDEDSDDDYGNNEREIEYREKTRAFFSHLSTGEQSLHPPISRQSSQVVIKTPARGPAPLPSARRTISEPTPSEAAVETPQPKVIKATPLLRKAVTAAQDTANTRTKDEAGVSFVEDTPVSKTVNPKKQPLLQRGSTYPRPQPSRVEQSPSSSSTMRKRKRGSSSSLKMVPESEQIFRGLSFYYIPDNDIAPIRKIRITRAREHGAQWIRTLDGATHVVVDKNLVYKDIENILAKTGGALPIIVNEDYPIDCITFRSLLNHDQQRYRVAGCPVSQRKNSTQSEGQQHSQVSDVSLIVQKHPKRMDSKPRAGTPPRSEESSARSAGNQQPKIVTEAEMFEEPADITKGGCTVQQTAASTPNNGPGKQVEHAQQPLQRKDSVGDELSEYISLIQQYKDLPLDSDEDDVQSTKGADEPTMDQGASSDSGSASSHSRKKPRRPKGRSGAKSIAFEERFACHQGGAKEAPLASGSTNPNARTIEVLQSMCDYYTRTNDHWRTTAYRKAISTLRRQTTKITTEEEAYRLPTIGPRLAAKIEEIATTDRLQRLQYAEDDTLTPVLEMFLKIYDVGVARATKWIAQGYRTLDDLLAKADLTTNQRLGIERYEDLNTRIPRAEVEALAGYVRRAAGQLDPAVELLVGGSYRRGADSSGDIDFIVTKKGTSSSDDLAPFLEELVSRLTDRNFLVAALAAHRPTSGAGGGSTWHGCCVLPLHEGKAAVGDDFKPRWRRIDFLLVPETEYGAALIYFTGNDIFNRSIRLLASRKGMRLNQRGLYKEVMRGPQRIKVTEGELVEGRDEKRIFEILGVKWREPRDRWC